MLKQKHTYRERNIPPISLKTSWPWYRQTSDCCWRNISSRDSSTKTRIIPLGTRGAPSCFDSRHFRFYPPFPSQIFLVGWQFLFFSNTKIKKRFSFRISSALILFPAVSLHMNSFVKFEFLISWNLGKWKLKIHFQLRYQAKISKLKIIVQFSFSLKTRNESRHLAIFNF